jgi:hypothetical protein
VDFDMAVYVGCPSHDWQSVLAHVAQCVFLEANFYEKRQKRRIDQLRRAQEVLKWAQSTGGVAATEQLQRAHEMRTICTLEDTSILQKILLKMLQAVLRTPIDPLTHANCVALKRELLFIFGESWHDAIPRRDIPPGAAQVCIPFTHTCTHSFKDWYNMADVRGALATALPLGPGFDVNHKQYGLQRPPRFIPHAAEGRMDAILKEAIATHEASFVTCPRYPLPTIDAINTSLPCHDARLNRTVQVPIIQTPLWLAWQQPGVAATHAAANQLVKVYAKTNLHTSIQFFTS